MAKKVEQIPMTQEEYDKLLQEQKKLEEEYAAVLIKLEEAKESGDLAENEAYFNAKLEQRRISDAISNLNHMLKNAVIVEKA